VDMKLILRMLLYFANTGQAFMVNLLTLSKMSALSITTTGITINKITTTDDYCVTVNICTNNLLTKNLRLRSTLSHTLQDLVIQS
jgi:hypothetical protein